MKSDLTMEGSNYLTCPDCDFRNREERKIEKHVKKSHGKQALKCPYCVPSVYSTSPSGLVRHKRQNHREARLNCFLCEFSTRGLKKWARHIKQNHAAQIGTVRCLVGQSRGSEMFAPSSVSSCGASGADEINRSSLMTQDFDTRARSFPVESNCLNSANRQPEKTFLVYRENQSEEKGKSISNSHKKGEKCQARDSNEILLKAVTSKKELRKSTVRNVRNISDKSVIEDCVDEIVVSDDDGLVKALVPRREDVFVVISVSDSVENAKHSGRNSVKMESVKNVGGNDSSTLLLGDRISKPSECSNRSDMNKESRLAMLSDDMNIDVKLKMEKTSSIANSGENAFGFMPLETGSAISKPHQPERLEDKELSKSKVITAVLNQQEKTSPKCPYCSRQWSSYSMLRAHCKIEHAAYIHPKYKCLKCTFESKWISKLLRHNLKHTGEKPFACHLCPDRFTIKHHLQRHLKAHFKDRPYSCKFCPFSATQKSDLVIHIRTHTNERPYKCTLCDYAAKTLYAFIVHIRTHTKEKPYRCEFCLKSFTQRSSRNLHVAKMRCENRLFCV